MKCALIDIGSNSMRLSVYRIDSEGSFETLFREKIMAGLAGFVEKKKLTAEGITRACAGLLQFNHVLHNLEIKDVSVFATASLRNVENTDEAVMEIERRTGTKVQILSGTEEALFGYKGAMQEFGLFKGGFVDIGGGSTEIVTFNGGIIDSAISYPLGSLRLYTDCVKKILPNKEALDLMEERIEKDMAGLKNNEKHDCIIGVGGTARATLKFITKLYNRPDESRIITRNQLNELWEILSKGDKEAIDLILKIEPERIHTIVPGLTILKEVMKSFGAKELLIGSYGVREGFLCHRIKEGTIATPKTEK